MYIYYFYTIYIPTYKKDSIIQYSNNSLLWLISIAVKPITWVGFATLVLSFTFYDNYTIISNTLDIFAHSLSEWWKGSPPPSNLGSIDVPTQTSPLALTDVRLDETKCIGQKSVKCEELALLSDGMEITSHKVNTSTVQEHTTCATRAKSKNLPFWCETNSFKMQNIVSNLTQRTRLKSLDVLSTKSELVEQFDIYQIESRSKNPQESVVYIHGRWFNQAYWLPFRELSLQNKINMLIDNQKLTLDTNVYSFYKYVHKVSHDFHIFPFTERDLIFEKVEPLINRWLEKPDVIKCLDNKKSFELNLFADEGSKFNFSIFYWRSFEDLFEAIANEALVNNVSFSTKPERKTFIKYILKLIYNSNPEMFGYCSKCNPSNISGYLNQIFGSNPTPSLTEEEMVAKVQQLSKKLCTDYIIFKRK